MTDIKPLQPEQLRSSCDPEGFAFKTTDELADLGEMIGQGVLAMQMELTLEELGRAVFPHPTLSESLPEAARQAVGEAIYLP